ncbi:MAG: AbrB/MazE/SpoVT family DNA-binding domain-containing protein [Carboxydocellales bacterium]
MKSTGIVRKVDDLGRVVVPIELRRTLGINEGDGLEIFVDNEKIFLKKYQPGCQICNQVNDITEIAGVRLCKKCVELFLESEKVTGVA